MNLMLGRPRPICAIFSIACLLLHLTGCSFFASSRQNISVTSEPPGADVTINGERAGRTPLVYSIERGQEAALIVNKEGYEPLTRRTSQSLSGVGIVDVIFGCFLLVPLLGLIADGAYKQEPENFAVVLSEKEAK